MPKTRTKYICQQCGGEQSKWMGKCPDCGAWNTLEEVAEIQLPQNSAQQRRQSLLRNSPIAQGTSTLLLQASGAIAKNLGPVLYVSGEESIEQVKMRAERLNISGERLYLLAAIEMDVITEAIHQLKPALVVIDSIQTVLSSHLTAAPGSISQVRECTLQLMQLAKNTLTPIFIIGHVTKEGTVAGPKALEHIADAVLYLEGERYHTYRLLRGVKNRFGATHEIGVFEMHG